MRTILSLLLALLLLFPCAGLGEDAPAEAPALLSVPLPIDFSGGTAPRDEFYLDEKGKVDDTLTLPGGNSLAP